MNKKHQQYYPLLVCVCRGEGGGGLKQQQKLSQTGKQHQYTSTIDRKTSKKTTGRPAALRRLQKRQKVSEKQRPKHQQHQKEH